MWVPFQVQQAKKHLTPVETPPSDSSRLSILENNPVLQMEVCVEVSENNWSVKPNERHHIQTQTSLEVSEIELIESDDTEVSIYEHLF